MLRQPRGHRDLIGPSRPPHLPLLLRRRCSRCALFPFLTTRNRLLLLMAAVLFLISVISLLLFESLLFDSLSCLLCSIQPAPLFASDCAPSAHCSRFTLFRSLAIPPSSVASPSPLTVWALLPRADVLQSASLRRGALGAHAPLEHPLRPLVGRGCLRRGKRPGLIPTPSSNPPGPIPSWWFP